ncbi:MAG: alpha/beta fold hydrolase [Acidimicrobiales bacterium]
MRTTRTLLGAAAASAGVAAVQGWRTRAARRRISWAPGIGARHDGALRARTIGDGPVGVVLLHGLCGSNAYWGGAYDALAGTGRLVVPDLLGFGDSPRPPSGYTAADHVEALLALLDELGVTGPVIVGAHSLGCLVALALAERRPDLVAGIVALCPPLYRDEAEARRRVARIGWLEHQIATGSPLAHAVCRWACAHHRAAVAIATVLRPGLPPVIRADALRHTWASYSQTFDRVLAAAEGGRWLAGVQVPVELIAGTADPVVDLGYLRGLAGTLSHVTLTIRDGADHDLPLTDPAGAVAALVTASRLLPRPPARLAAEEAPEVAR